MLSGRGVKLIVGVVTGCGAFLIGWLFDGEKSPFNEYFLFHTTVPNLWSALNMPAYFVALLIAAPFGGVGFGGLTGSGEVIGVTVLFIYWFAIGYFIVVPVGRLFFQRRHTS